MGQTISGSDNGQNWIQGEKANPEPHQTREEGHINFGSYREGVLVSDDLYSLRMLEYDLGGKAWVVQDRERSLWLPLKYSLLQSAVLVSRIVIGCRSGRILVLVIDFSERER